MFPRHSDDLFSAGQRRNQQEGTRGRGQAPVAVLGGEGGGDGKGEQLVERFEEDAVALRRLRAAEARHHGGVSRSHLPYRPLQPRRSRDLLCGAQQVRDLFQLSGLVSRIGYLEVTYHALDGFDLCPAQVGYPWRRFAAMRGARLSEVLQSGLSRPE